MLDDLHAPLVPKDIEKLMIFNNVAFEAVWGLLEECPLHILTPGETLFKAGQMNQIIYMILSGSMSVHLENPEDDPVAYLNEGQMVGEISVIGSLPVTAHVVAKTSVRLLAVDEAKFWRLINASHEFAKNIFHLFIQRLRANNFALSESTRQKKDLEKVVTIDGLTGLHNRRWLDDILPRLIRRQKKDGYPLSILMLDIDHFKKFNDNHGHQVGDQALLVLAQTMSVCMRPTDLSARYGGEEFLIILPNTDLPGAGAAAERLRKAVASVAVEVGDQHCALSMTISIGAAQLAEDEIFESLLLRADKALYIAKNSGRNRVEIAPHP